LRRTPRKIFSAIVGKKVLNNCGKKQNRKTERGLPRWKTTYPSGYYEKGTKGEYILTGNLKRNTAQKYIPFRHVNGRVI